MAAPEVARNDWVEVNLVGRYHGQVCITTHLYLHSGESQAGMTLDLEQVADEFLLVFWTDPAPRYRDKLSSAYTLTAVTAQIISPVRSILWPAAPQAADAPGLVAGASLPSGVAAVVRRRGNIGDRHNYGRVYLPGLSVTYVLDSQLTQLGKDALQVVADAMATDQLVPGTGGNAIFQPHILNKANIPASRIVTHGQVDPIVRYQRRREVGVGI